MPATTGTCSTCRWPLAADYYCPMCEIVRDPRITLTPPSPGGPHPDYGFQYFSRTPILDFKGKGPLHLGLELEVTSSTQGHEIAWRYLQNGKYGWLKGDASVQGFEMNSHPMTYTWAKNHFPWEMLIALRAAGCDIITSTNGIHVHVSRKGFTNLAHEFSWMKFMYRNQKQVIALARRHSTRWGRFTSRHRQSQMVWARTAHTTEQLNRTGRGTVARVELSDKLARRRSEASAALGYQVPGMGRPAAISLDTYHGTHEVRVFAATLRPQQALAALGLIDSTVRYTQTITVADITGKNAWSWDAYHQWLTRHHRKLYAPLLAEIAERI